MFRKTLVALGAAAALTFIPTSAYALHCENVSRPAYTGSEYLELAPDFHIHLQGNWVFIQEADAWVFVPPGSLKLIGEPPLTPGSNGNFQNGQAIALLENSVCNPENPAFVSRQTEHGIQWCHEVQP